MMAGGMTNVKPADNEAQQILDRVKAETEQKAGRTFPSLTAKQYATQVVAGTNYFIKADAGNGEHVHVRVFQGLPPGQALSVHSVQTGKSENDALTYF